MTPVVFVMVLSAALLHATWNAIVKASGDRTIVLGLISFGHVVSGIALAFFVPIPAAESWPFIIASTFIHYVYYYLLNRSYRLGDLSQVYPIARGISPVLIAIGAQFAAGEVLPAQAWAGILVVTAGIFLLSSGAWKSKLPPAFLVLALATGLSISAYSLVDGLGARASSAALGYIAWLFIFEIPVVLFVLARRGRRVFASRRVLIMGFSGGVISGVAYGLVIVANTLAPLGIVSTLRETSVLFAAAIGVIILGERPWHGRLIAAVVVVLGVTLLALA